MLKGFLIFKDTAFFGFIKKKKDADLFLSERGPAFSLARVKLEDGYLCSLDENEKVFEYYPEFKQVLSAKEVERAYEVANKMTSLLEASINELKEIIPYLKLSDSDKNTLFPFLSILTRITEDLSGHNTCLTPNDYYDMNLIFKIISSMD